MSQAARDLVVREYSWDRIGEQLESACACAIGGPCSGSFGDAVDPVAPICSNTLNV